MKKILALIVFTITTIFSAYAVEYNFEDLAFYKGNPFQNKIITAGEMYVVIHNPTELALNVMLQGAKDYCKKTSGDNFTSNYLKMLGQYSAYFACYEENKIAKYNLTSAEEECIRGRNFMSNDCTVFNEKNADIINAIELQEINEEKHKSLEFIFLTMNQFYYELQKLELIAKKNTQQSIIENNIDICKQYTFEEGSDLFLKCILSLLSGDGFIHPY